MRHFFAGCGPSRATDQCQCIPSVVHRRATRLCPVREWNGPPRSLRGLLRVGMDASTPKRGEPGFAFEAEERITRPIRDRYDISCMRAALSRPRWPATPLSRKEHQGVLPYAKNQQLIGSSIQADENVPCLVTCYIPQCANLNVEVDVANARQPKLLDMVAVLRLDVGLGHLESSHRPRPATSLLTSSRASAHRQFVKQNDQSPVRVRRVRCWWAAGRRPERAESPTPPAPPWRSAREWSWPPRGGW